MKLLIRSYLFAIPIILIGLAITLIWFPSLVLWYLIATLVSMINYYLLIRIQNYQNLTQQNVLLTLLIRYIIFGATLFTIIWINKDNPQLVQIGVILAIGISVMKLAAIINRLTSKEGSDVK